MKLSNFRNLKSSGPYTFAEVDVEESGFFGKKIKSVVIFREAVYWKFLETGNYCPNMQAENLENCYKARIALERIK